MSIENEFVFIGWNEQGTSDKVWGYFLRPTPDAQPWVSKLWGWNCCIFWARRGKAVQFKASTTGQALNKLVESKLIKGYDEISEKRLLEIWPNFIQEAESKLMWDVLAGKVK